MEILIKFPSNSTEIKPMPEFVLLGTPARLLKVLFFAVSFSEKFDNFTVFQSNYFRYAAETGKMSFLGTYHNSSSLVRRELSKNSSEYKFEHKTCFDFEFELTSSILPVLIVN